MRILHTTMLLVVGAVLGCMASGVPITAQDAEEPQSPLGSPFADQTTGGAGWIGTPLIIDRMDLSIGTTVHFDRMPTEGELYDLRLVTALKHVVITLPAWPADYARLDALRSVPREADVMVILPGYPESRAAADIWNAIDARLRIILIVNEPPWRSGMVSDLNAMRSLDRVIAQLDEPSRRGFERLQRPLSFRKVVP